MTILLKSQHEGRVEEEGGVKIPKNLTTWFMDDPLCNAIFAKVP